MWPLCYDYMVCWMFNVCYYSVCCYVYHAGLAHLIDEISQDHFSKAINSLCCIESSPQFGSPRFVCFEIAQPLEPILNSYHMLSLHYASDLFKHIWTSALKTEAKTKLTATFTDVVARAWNPVFAQCCWLIDNVQTRKIKLKDVDEYFGHYEGGHLIIEQLHNLYSAIEACSGKPVNETRWIRSSVDLMEQYWALCEQAEAANIILDLKKSLRLTGNFEIIEHVANQVTESMREKSLDNIDRKLIDAKSFLEEMTADARKLECLRQFAACSNIVEWIRKETTGKFLNH